VLRVGVGAQVRCGVIDESVGTGTVLEVLPEAVLLQYSASTEFVSARPAIDLLLALPRPKVMKRLWAQLAALGVRRIIVSAAWKVERPYFDSHVLEPLFVGARLREGLSQAGDIYLPAVSVHRQFKVLVEDDLDDLSNARCRLVLDPAGNESLASISLSNASDGILAAVGPEGGWTPYELDLLSAHGFERVRINDRTLRSDTACVATLAILACRTDRVPMRGG
jgi:RsmE family RNA methyltransferase